ncbi:MAG: hypothetical protein JW881_04330 [Spirochaetales bacterium]|nr:hypothetical protein [Spirochaetales bacterium]
MIQGIGAAAPVFIPNIIRLRSGAGKVAAPVQRHYIPYARFRHITGVPSGNNSAGVPVYKLRVLDNLIDRLVSGGAGNSFAQEITNDNIDLMIDRAAREVRSRETALRMSPAVFSPRAGIVIDTFA